MSGFSKAQIKKELGQLYPVAPPQRKEEFLKELPFPKTSPMETIGVQLGYIRKSVWILTLLLIVAALILGKGYWKDARDYGMLCYFSAIMPLLAVLAVTESFRSSVHGMAELEMTARHNLQQVLLIRMGAISGVDFLLMMSALPFLAEAERINVFRGAVYLMVPWLCTCVLALQIEKYVRGRDGIWCCCAVGAFICGISLMAGKIRETVYGSGKFYIWVIAFFIFAVVLAKQIWQICHEIESWNQNLYQPG